MKKRNRKRKPVSPERTIEILRIQIRAEKSVKEQMRQERDQGLRKINDQNKTIDKMRLAERGLQGRIQDLEGELKRRKENFEKIFAERDEFRRMTWQFKKVIAALLLPWVSTHGQLEIRLFIKESLAAVGLGIAFETYQEILLELNERTAELLKNEQATSETNDTPMAPPGVGSFDNAEENIIAWIETTWMVRPRA